MMGTVVESSRIIFVASRPSRLGILMSIRIRSGFASSYDMTASIPSRARISLYFLPRMAFSKSKLLSSSSAIRIVCWLGEASAELPSEQPSSVFPDTLPEASWTDVSANVPMAAVSLGFPFAFVAFPSCSSLSPDA